MADLLTKALQATTQGSWDDEENVLLQDSDFAEQQPGTNNYLKIFDWEKKLPPYRDIKGLEVHVQHRLTDLTSDQLGGEVSVDYDVGYVVDVSGSMGTDMGGITRIDAVKDGMTSANDDLFANADNRGALTKFDTVGTLVQGLTGTKATLNSAIAGLSLGGGTNIQAGMVTMRTHFEGTAAGGRTRVMIVMSDGIGGDPVAEANDIKADHPDWLLYAIGIYADPGDPGATTMEAVGIDGYFHAPTAEDVQEAITSIIGGLQDVFKSRLEVSLTLSGYTPLASSAKVVSADPSTGWVTTVLGGPNDLWGQSSFTVDQINNSLGILIRRSIIDDENATNTREVNFVELVVYHTPTGGSIAVAERESVRQQIRYAEEGTPGTAAAVDKRFRGLILNPSPSTDFKQHRPQGEKLESNHLLIKEWAQSGLSGIPCYDEIGRILRHHIGAQNTTGSGVADERHIHIYRLDNRGPQVPPSLTVEYGEELSRMQRVTNLIFNEFGIDMSRSEAAINGNAIGTAIEDGISPTPGRNDQQTLTITATSGNLILNYAGKKSAAINCASLSAGAIQTALNDAGCFGTAGVAVTGSGPYLININGTNYAGMLQPKLTVDPSSTMSGGTATIAHTQTGGFIEYPLIPILPSHVNVYLADTYDTLSSNKMTRCTMLNYATRDRVGQFWTLNRSLGTSYAGNLELPMTGRFTLKAHAGSEVMALLPSGRSDAKKFIRMECVGPNIGSTGLPHKYIIDACVKVAGFGPLEDSDGMYEATYELAVAEDITWGNSILMELHNGIPAYA